MSAAGAPSRAMSDCSPIATGSFVHLQHKDHNGYDPDEGQWHASVNEGGEGFQLVVEVIADETHTEPHDREVCQDVGFANDDVLFIAIFDIKTCVGFNQDTVATKRASSTVG